MLVPGNTLCFRWQNIALKERKQPQSVCELKDVLWETGMKTIREATSTRLYGFIASSGALTAECVYIQEGAIYTRHTLIMSVALAPLSVFLHVAHTDIHALTHPCQAPPSHQPSIFFPPSTPWHPAVGRDIRKKQSERRREKREGVRGRNTTGKKRYRKCGGQRELFKERVRRCKPGKKRLRGSKWRREK